VSHMYQASFRFGDAVHAAHFCRPEAEVQANFPCRNIGASAIKPVEILRPTPPGPTPVPPTQHAIDNPAHLMAKWMWLSNLLQSGILTINKIRDLDRRLSGHHQNC
jgi:hypothetical protein